MTDALVVKEGPLAGQRLELGGEVVLGREGDPVEIDDQQLSRRHAVVRPVADGFEVEDLGSLNGTFVNDQRIEAPTPLAGGDMIKVGQTVLEVELARVPASVGATVQTPVETAAAVAPTTATPAPEPPPPAAPPPPQPPAAPAAPPAPAAPSAAPAEPFGAYAVPESKRRRGIASRQWGPMVASWAAVIATAVALAIYFADHPT